MILRLDKPFESVGGFSVDLPDGPHVHGRLSYDPNDGICLSLFERPKALSIRDGDPRTIFGTLVNGTPVTLSGCFVTHAAVQFGIGIGSPTTIFAERALFGIHAPSIDQQVIGSYSIELSSLGNWMCERPVKLRLPGNPRQKELDIQYCGPKPVRVALDGTGYDIQIGHQYSLSHDTCALALGWGASIAVISLGEALTLAQAAKAAWQVRNLMALLIGHQPTIRSVTASTAGMAEDESGNGLLQLLFQQHGRHDCVDEIRHRMCLPYDAIAAEFPDMVRKWFGRNDQAKLATDALIGLRLANVSGAHMRFLLATQAAESYHRSLQLGTYMGQEAFDEAMDQWCRTMPKCISGDHRQSLTARVKYGNEFSLRKRLGELFRRIPDVVCKRIVASRDVFIERVVAARNFYTHLDKRAAMGEFEGRDAYYSTERLVALVIANLFRDLGVSDEKLLDAVNKTMMRVPREPG